MPGAAAPRVGCLDKCAQCGSLYEPTPGYYHGKYCGDACRYRAKHAAITPERRRAVRERSRAWAAEHRGCKRRQPWLFGAPVSGTHLPGGGFVLDVSPSPRWPVELRNTRALHGMVTRLLATGHTPNVPDFALVPVTSTAFGWGVYVRDEEQARRLAGKRHGAALYDRPVTVRAGPLFRLRSPRVEKRGRRRLRIDAVTPVCVRQNASTSTHTMPTAGNLTSTLAAWLPRRLGVELEHDSVRVELVERETFPATVETGGKFGVTRGWVGHCLVETNAVGEWLLRCAELVGLGGRVTLGLGRIRVTACES